MISPGVQARAEVAERHYQEAKSNAIRSMRDAAAMIRDASIKAVMTGREAEAADLHSVSFDLETLIESVVKLGDR